MKILALVLLISSGLIYGGEYLGEFESIESGKNVEGEISLKTKKGLEGKLVFKKDFLTDDAPDLRVYLHTKKVPKRYVSKNSVFLGKLKKFKGFQKYELPADIDLAKFKYVVIYCKKFHTNFGSARLLKK